jgi:hypothetical protein
MTGFKFNFDIMADFLPLFFRKAKDLTNYRFENGLNE